jgi:hypothetical protein
MNGTGYTSASHGSSQGTKRRVPTKKYFTLQDDFIILDKFKRKGMVDVNDIVEDVALHINRDPASIKERFKKLNGLSDEDKNLLVNHRKVC